MQHLQQFLLKPHQRRRLGKLAAADEEGVLDPLAEGGDLGRVQTNAMLAQYPGNGVEQAGTVSGNDGHDVLVAAFIGADGYLRRDREMPDLAGQATGQGALQRRLAAQPGCQVVLDQGNGVAIGQLAAGIEHPITPAQAPFSIGFAIAVAAVHGETSAFAFAPQRLEDPAVQALMSRIVVQHDPVLDRDYPAKRAARVEIVTDSAVHAGQVDYPVGEPENPASSEALTRKYEELATPVLGADAVRVRDLVLDLERQASLAPLFEVLARARPSGGANDEVARRASVAA